MSAAVPQPINAHAWEREANEHYVEPEWCSRRLFEVEPFVQEIWDPACGFGRIVESAKAHGHAAFGSDLVDRGYAPARVFNFFTGAPAVCANIVTNPPFNIAADFARRAIELTRHKVAIVFPTARLNAAHWVRNTPLARVWLLTPRPSMPPGHVIAAGGKATGGKMDFCWMVFDRSHQGKPQLGWLRRDS